MEAKNRHTTKLVFLLLTFCLPFLSLTVAFAQDAELYGYVYDRQTGEALPFATVRIHESSKGITTDEAGAYSLRVDSGLVQISYEFLSYNDTLITFKFLPGQRIRQDVYLSPDTLLMDEVTVSADRVARKIQNLAKERNEQLKKLRSYQADVYKLAILSKVQGKYDPEDSTPYRKIPMAFSERKSSIIYTTIPERFTETVEAHRASKNFFSEYDFFSTGGGPMNLNREEVDVSILSEALTVIGPISEDAGKYYDLYETDADSSWPTNTKEIYFKPLSNNLPLFKGKIWIDEQSNSILGIDVQLNQYAHTNTGTFQVSDLRYTQSFTQVEGFWLPQITRLSAVIKFIGNSKPVLYEDEWSWSNYEINDAQVDAQSADLSTTHILSKADNRSRRYWNNVQSGENNNNFDLLDEARKYKEERESVLIGMYAMRSVFKFPVWLQNSYFTNFSDFYHFNRVEGHYLGVGLRTPVHEDYDFRASAGFGFGNESQSYQLKGYYYTGFIAPEFAFRKETVPQYQDYEYNRTPIDFFEARQTLNALFTGSTAVNYFERKGWEAGLRFRFGTESFLRASYASERHRKLNSSTSYNVLGNSMNTILLENNDPVYPAEDGNLKGLYLHLHHDTRQYVQTQFLRDYNIRRFGWLGDAVLERGIGKWGSDFSFTRYRLGLKLYWPVFTSHFFQTDITFGASDSGTPHQRIFSYNGFVVDDYVRYRPFNTINYREPIGYRVSELRIRYKFGTSLTRKLPIDFLARSGVKISTFLTVGVIDENPSLEPLLPHSGSHTQAEIGIAVTRIFGFFYTEFSKRLYGDYGNSIGFTARF